MEENAASADIKLNQKEVKKLDEILDTIEMSEVFGGSRVKLRTGVFRIREKEDVQYAPKLYCNNEVALYIRVKTR